MTVRHHPGDSSLARPELVPLVDELARRFDAGDVPVMVTLRQLPTSTRHALADLFGRDRLPPPTSRVPVNRLIEALGLDSVAQLRAVVESLRCTPLATSYGRGSPPRR